MDITTEEGASKVREVTCCMGVVNALQKQLTVEEGDRKMDTMDTAANAVRCKGDFVVHALPLMISFIWRRKLVIVSIDVAVDKNNIFGYILHAIIIVL